jgi:hypothetical protein
MKNKKTVTSIDAEVEIASLLRSSADDNIYLF